VNNLFGTELEQETLVELKTKKADKRVLVIYNDDVNTFEFVIETLIEVCGHDMLQAEQCTLIIHYKGKCDVKIGSYSSLKPLKDELLDRGLSAVIE
jgi:ATP-dependent Clp protease adaptor protein ClpS